MNTKNNKKYQETEKLICDTFLTLLEEKCLKEISITEICTRCGITRATFYAHSKDIRELMKKTDEMLSQTLIASIVEYVRSHPKQWDIRDSFVKLFEHVKKHRYFYRIYISHVPIFPLFSVLPDSYLQISGENIYKKSHLDMVESRKLLFHSSFFYAGMIAFLRIWLESDCAESIDEMLSLVYEQYHYRSPDVWKEGDFFQCDITPAADAISDADHK